MVKVAKFKPMSPVCCCILSFLHAKTFKIRFFNTENQEGWQTIFKTQVFA
jgi:hypothetical protein